MSVVEQAIVIRKDLEWPLGPICAQASHVSNALMFEHGFSHPIVESYRSDIKNMKTVTFGISSEAKLTNLAAKVAADDSVISYLWIEQPEDVPAALAILGPSDAVKTLTKRLRLL